MTTSFKRCITEKGLVMHYQIPLDKVETICLSFPRTIDHLFFHILTKLREFVDCLHGISSIWWTERDIKIVFFDEIAFEKVPFNHTEFLYCLISHFEVQARSNILQSKEVRTKVVPYCPHLLRNWFSNILLRLLDLKEYVVTIHIPDSELYKLDIIDIG